MAEAELETRGSRQGKKKRADGPRTCRRLTRPTLPPRKQKNVDDTPTASAHPARFSPDDKFSRERVECKRRFGLLPTQKPPPVL